MVYSDSDSSDGESEKQSPHDKKAPIDGIALHAFVLGIFLTISVLVLAWVRIERTASPHWRIPFFLATSLVFHFLDFWTAARYRYHRDPGGGRGAGGAASRQYLSAARHFIDLGDSATSRTCLLGVIVATAECLVWHVLFWNYRFTPFLKIALEVYVGFAMVAAGQVVRCLGVMHSGPFSSISDAHITTARRKKKNDSPKKREQYSVGSSNEKQQQQPGGHGETRPEHRPVLVAQGIYRWLRHPSYLGLFWWAVGTQLVMGNIFSLFGSVVVVWSMAAGRARKEEQVLVRVFGIEYEDYRRRVGGGLPLT